MTKRPSRVALLVATKEEHRSWAVTAGSVSSSARRKLLPVTVEGETCSASSSWERSTALLSVTTSSRSTSRPLNLAPALAAPSAMPFISSRYSGS